ncbi:hypothetical protein V494_04849 [Pseudogymnoascus sp. VKM F-4513 (FW-928)]|nr:hypothetical protein V494_04849 [Pseudogymnoascus sp. VKM F-4513 (FW-928)]
MPLEVFLQISSYLTTRDLGYLRLTCKHAEALLFETFAREFFTKKQFMRSEISLQALIDISNHQRLSQFLSHVIIGLDSFENARIPLDFRQTQPARAKQYNARLADERTFLSTGQDREMLTQAFRNLPNLQIVGLRDYSSGGRDRDNGEWNSYGATTILDEIRFPLLGSPFMYAHDGDVRFAGEAFSSLLYALGQSGAKPQAFEVLLRKPNLGLPYDAFKIPHFFEPSVLPLLSSLKTILLTIHPGPFNDDGSDEDPDVEYPDFPLRQFLSHVSNITHLRINFKSQLRSTPHRFMAWLGRSASVNLSPGSPLPKSPDPVALSHLQRLDIGMLTVSRRNLLAIIHRLQPTLRSLSLWKVDLRPEDQHQPDGNKASMWSKFFGKLSDLDYLSVGCIGQMVRSHHVRVAFKLPDGQSGDPDITRVCSVSSDMARFIDSLVSDVIVNSPEVYSGSEDESMYDDDSDTDEDVDDDE